MTFADRLRRMNACPEAVAWVGSRTLEQAWAECKRGDWMLWYAARRLPSNDPRLRLIAADCAERVWHLVPADAQLACAWAIDVARRTVMGKCDEDERWAAEAACAAEAATYAAEAAAYDAAKHGLAGFTKCVALEVAQADIIRNYISAADLREEG